MTRLMSNSCTQRCSEMLNCRASLMRPHIRLQSTFSWRHSHANRPSSSHRNPCQAARQTDAEQSSDGDSEAASQPTVTEEQRRIALRLPPKPAPGAPSDSESREGGSGRGSSPQGDDGGPRMPGMFDRIIIVLGGQAGIRGSLALLLAYFVHLDAFGNIHWDSHDLLAGLALGSPVIFIDLFLLLGNWSPKLAFKAVPAREMTEAKEEAGGTSLAERAAAAKRIERLVNMASERMKASTRLTEVLSESEQLAASSAAYVDASLTGEGTAAPDDAPDTRKILIREPQSALIAALESHQRRTIMGYPNPKEPAWVQALFVLVTNFPEDMLYRAVGLTATVGWTTDRLFEAGLDNVVDINGLSVPTVELGGWIALAAWCSISVAQAVVPLVAPQKVQIVNSKGEKVEEPPRIRQQGKERENRKLLEQSLSKMSASNRNTLAVKKLREAVKTGVLGASFLLTGNLLASYGSLVVIGAVSAVCQNIREKQYVQEQDLKLKNLMSEALRLRARLNLRLKRMQAEAKASAAALEDDSQDASAVSDPGN